MQCNIPDATQGHVYGLYGGILAGKAQFFKDLFQYATPGSHRKTTESSPLLLPPMIEENDWEKAVIYWCFRSVPCSVLPLRYISDTLI